MACHAGHIPGSGMPLRFSGQLSLSQKIERRTLPAGVTEAAIIGFWSKVATLGFTRQRRTIERRGRFRSKFTKFNLSAIRQHQVESPILPRLERGPRRLSAQEYSKVPAKFAIEFVHHQIGNIRAAGPGVRTYDGRQTGDHFDVT